MFRISSTENAVTSITINGQTYNFKDTKSRQLIETVQTLLGDGVDGSVVASDTEPDGEGVKIWINTNELVAAEGEEYYNKVQTDALLNGIRAQIGNSSSISIDDSNIGETKTWSSQKISQELQSIVAGGTVENVVNLFDKNNKVTSFVDDNGTVNGNFTNWIKVELGQKYVTNLNYTQFYFFDENKNYESVQTYITAPVIATGNGGYLLIKINNTNEDEIKIYEGTDIDKISTVTSSKWRGKRWLCIGDSISTNNAGLATDGYAKLISRDLGMILTNIAVSGKIMKDAYEWIDNLSEKFDLITIMMGTNNQGYNCALGALNDTYYIANTYNSNDSFFAQTQLLIEKLKLKYPKSKIIFLTPLKRTGCGSEAIYNDENGYFKKLHTTKEYRDVIINCCEYYSIPYVDLYNTLDPRLEANRELYFMSATDGTHPNDLGHALYLAPVIRAEIEKQAPYYFNDFSTVIPIEPPSSTYTVTNNLTNCTNSNNASSIEENASYSAVITANQGYELSNVVVTMGDNNVEVTGGNISIANVTGDIAITATATEQQVVNTNALIHSYDFTALGAGATIAEDLTNNFDLELKNSATGDGTDYKTTNAGVSINKNADNTFIFGRESRDFTLALNLQATDLYSTASINTGVKGGMNLSPDGSSINGRFILKQGAESGAISTGIKFGYYKTGSLIENYYPLKIATTQDDIHIVKFKLDTLTVEIHKYYVANNELQHDMQSFVVTEALRFDGMHMGGNMVWKKLNLYNYVLTDTESENLAKNWLGITTQQ